MRVLPESIAEVEGLLIDSLEGRRYFTIAGITIDLSDFVAIWNGEDVLPQLSPVERKAYDFQYSFDEGVGLVYGNLVSFGDVGPNALRLIMRRAKYKKIKKLIAEHKHDNANSQLSMERVLVMYEENMRFSSVAEFVANLPGVDPTAEEAARVRGAVSEQISPSDREVHFLEEHGVEELRNVTDETRRSLFANLMGVKPREIEKIPLFILERVVFSQKPAEDEYLDLVQRTNVGTHHLASLINVLRLASFYGGFAVMASSLYRIVATLNDGLPSPEFLEHMFGNSVEQMTAGLYMFMPGVLTTAVYPMKLHRTLSKLHSGKREHEAAYAKLNKYIAELESSPLGKVKILLMRGLTQEAYGDGEFDEDLHERFLEINSDKELRAEFNEFAGMHSPDYDDPESVRELFRQFEASQHAEIDLAVETGDSAGIEQLLSSTRQMQSKA